MEHVDGTGPHVLVVDDEPTIREVLCAALADEGYRVTSHDTYFEDLDLVLRLAPNLVVLDIVMAGRRTGMDFLERLKADARTVRIPIAVCTAARHLTDEITARLTAWDCLIIPKPFDLDDLLAEISRCLHQHAVEPATA
jgi:DNA-binding response OmpR family regulator